MTETPRTDLEPALEPKPAPTVSSPSAAPEDVLADAQPKHWSEKAPGWMRPYLRLSRLDRPVGWQLLYVPCLMGIGLAASEGGFWLRHLTFAALFLAGAIAARGAGCTYNDIVDRKIDSEVARTRNRPIPAGQVSVPNAWAWLGVQVCIGLGVLIALPQAARLTALAAIPLVAAYPFMKRITWWPQAWLGLCFSWGVLVASAAEEGVITFDALLLFAGCILWVIAYDTIYALQDREDDALVGVRSTARLFGKRWRLAIAIFYVTALFLWGLAATAAGAGVSPILALAVIGALLVGPLIDRIDDSDPASALKGFKFNVLIGLAVAAAFALNPLWVSLAPHFNRATGAPL